MKSYLQKHNKIKYSDHWATPKEIYNHYINDKGYYDPCPLNSNDFKFSTLKGCIFLNPPYSDITRWIDWILENQKTNQYYDYFTSKPKKYHVVILIPSRTDTKYFHKLLEYGCDLEFIKGRLKFGDYKGSAPFPSVLIHLDKNS